jgi:hypothetical protein
VRGTIGLLWLGAVILVSCAPTPGAQLGEGVLVVDEASYPGEAGPHLGEIATTQEEADALWDTLDLPGQPPDLDADALVILAGGEREDCPWRLRDVSAEADRVVVAVRPYGWFTRLRAGGRCAGDWSPRTVGFTVPAGAVGQDAAVAIDLPWEYAPLTARSLDQRPDPILWRQRTLSADDLGEPWGCESAYVLASTPDGAVRLMIDWSPTSARRATDGFHLSGSLPMDGVVVSIVSGSLINSDLCIDIAIEHRPLVAGRWAATSGYLDVEVEEEVRNGRTHPLATVVLRDATFESHDPAGGDPWYVEEIRFDDAAIGGFAG